MTVSVATLPSVTDNSSHSGASSVIRNDCNKCEHEPVGERHCRRCHGDDHRECQQCGACLPAGHRRDRYYCGSTCRGRKLKWARSPEGLAEAARLDGVLGRLVSIEGGAASPEEHQSWHRQRDLFREAARTGETCAVCGLHLEEPIHLRSVETGLTFGAYSQGVEHRLAAVCPDHLCDHHEWRAGFCDKCRPMGWGWTYNPIALASQRVLRWRCPDWNHEDHPNRYCRECHPYFWVTSRCAACDRAVTVRHHENRPWVSLPDNGSQCLVYCSQRCRSRVAHDRAAEKRTEQRLEQGAPRCAECDEPLDGRRWGSQYCSSACRQHAYRKRVALASGATPSVLKDPRASDGVGVPGPSPATGGDRSGATSTSASPVRSSKPVWRSHESA